MEEKAKNAPELQGPLQEQVDEIRPFFKEPHFFPGVKIVSLSEFMSELLEIALSEPRETIAPKDQEASPIFP